MWTVDRCSGLREMSGVRTEARFQCEICHTGYSLRRNLQLHIKNYHGADARPFNCNFCPHVCKNKQSLRNHINSKHKNLKHMIIPH